MIQIKEHLPVLSQSFEGYFPHGDISDSHGWIHDPFLFTLDLMDENHQKKDDLVEMRASKKIKMEFESMHLAAFWCAQLEMFPQLAKSSLNILVPFATTYLCESGFSTLVSIKTKPRNRLDPGDDMHVAIAKKEPRFKLIIEKMQQQKSH